MDADVDQESHLTQANIILPGHRFDKASSHSRTVSQVSQFKAKKTTIQLSGEVPANASNEVLNKTLDFNSAVPMLSEADDQSILKSVQHRAEKTINPTPIGAQD
jgi:hypothetical protein